MRFADSYDVSAHGLGGAKDLPIPVELMIAGAVAALVVSFTVLALAWRTPRYRQAPAKALPGLGSVVDSPGFAWTLRIIGLVIGGYVAAAAMFGKDLLTNPFFGVVFVLVWVGIVPGSLLLGPVWRALSPARTLHLMLTRVTGGDPGDGMLRFPERLGLWPAALMLFAFVWIELVFPGQTDLGPLRTLAALYFAFLVIGAAVYGDRWFAAADPFEVYSELVSWLSPWGRDEHGTLAARTPLANLAHHAPTDRVTPGLAAVTGVLFGSTGFDSFRESPFWLNVVQNSQASVTLLNTLALTFACLLVIGVFVAATTATGVEPGTDRRTLPARFAHSLVPIIVGYMAAHYLTYFVEYGQTTMIQLSDPFQTGANLLGTGNLAVSYWLSFHPTLLACFKVIAVVLGHVCGVLAAHDRSIELLPKRHQLTGQLPLLFAMVGFTAGGLYLLFAT